MKKLLVFALLAASPAMAGRMDEIVIMTLESVEETLGLPSSSEFPFTVTSQDFTKAAPSRDLAVKTELFVTNENGTNQEWTCVTQFVKTPKFFKVSETDCN
ncbi:hypothetical protein [Bdellovibrio bacteriovorus]|uniref:hypothetical protein n=1 Tax=Bdellovibrio TaxID=958 RepID=UPI0035A89678